MVSAQVEACGAALELAVVVVPEDAPVLAGDVAVAVAKEVAAPEPCRDDGADRRAPPPPGAPASPGPPPSPPSLLRAPLATPPDAEADAP